MTITARMEARALSLVRVRLRWTYPCEIKGSIFLPTSSSLPTRRDRL